MALHGASLIKEVHKIWHLVSLILLKGLILIVNCIVVSPKPNVNPTLFVISCKSLGDQRFIVLANNITNQVDFCQISIIHDNDSSQVADKRRYNFGQSMNSFIINDNICSLIHKKCHPKVTVNSFHLIAYPRLEVTDWEHYGWLKNTKSTSCWESLPTHNATYNVIQIHNNIMWNIPTFKLNMRNILYNNVGPIENFYGFK